MTPTFTLTHELRDEFEQRGLVLAPGLISPERLGRARQAVLRRLELAGLWRGGAWRLDAVPRPQWPDHGLKTSKVIGNKHPELAALIEEPALAATVEALLEGRRFDRAIYPRPQVLFTLPNADAWTVPTGWHVDCARLASGARPGAQVFMLLDEVRPGGGATAVVAGSHRLLNDGRFIKAKELKRSLCREPFFRDFYAGPRSGAPAVVGLPKGAVGDVPVEVVELTGSPGDAWFVDLRVLHSAAPNAADRPRLMATHRFLRADLVREVAEAYGWTKSQVTPPPP